VMCEKEGRLGVLGEVVDHIRPHKGSLKAFWDMTNWQTLCAFHHNNRKRDVERLGFSREIGLDGWPVDPAHPANRRP
jgi:5-methylcytosine-specific restriction protein A